MVSEDRQRVIETNRSLRLIKNELEALLERGVITDDAFDTMQRLLPNESSLSARSPAARTTSPPPSSPAGALSGLKPNSSGGGGGKDSSKDSGGGPPSYSQSTGSGGGPPALPSRNQPRPAPARRALAHVRALYGYAGSSGDCSFERGDRLAVYEHMNADWWMGRNLRTGDEGLFPKTYVEVEAADEKAPAPSAYPPPPPQLQPHGAGQASPYNSSVPPMAVAEGVEQNKSSGYGKKLGKKLGDAAVFGAGATIGGKIVNSIF